VRDSSAQLVLPRGLIFFAAAWLIASWLMTIGLRPPVQPSSASYTPAIRVMMLSVTIGAIIGWPLLRLSQHKPALPVRQTLLDLIVIIALIQVVIWPLRLVTTWSPMRTAAIEAALLGWLLLAGAVVVAAISTDQRGPRTLAMLACVAMCLLGPLLAWVGVMTGVNAVQLVSLSPLMAVRTLGDGTGPTPTDAQWALIALLGAAALLAWVALGVTAFMTNRSDGATEETQQSKIATQ
jgi:hypothetical protein